MARNPYKEIEWRCPKQVPEMRIQGPYIIINCRQDDPDALAQFLRFAHEDIRELLYGISEQRDTIEDLRAEIAEMEDTSDLEWEIRRLEDEVSDLKSKQRGAVTA